MCAILFAAVGNFVKTLLPTRYEQSVDFQILFEPNQNIDWTDKEMLVLTETVGGLINDPSIQTAVIQSLQKDGFDLNDSAFPAFTGLEQRYYGWKLKVNTNDPKLTEAFLSTWQTKVSEVIQHDLVMSQQTQQQRAIAAAWIPCLQLLPAEPMHPICNPQNASQVAVLYNQAVDQYQAAQQEILFLKNFPSAYTITPIETSNINQVSLVKQSSLMFTGLLAGLLIGAITVQTPWTYHLNFKRGES